jgi:hypothetical protein
MTTVTSYQLLLVTGHCRTVKRGIFIDQKHQRRLFMSQEEDNKAIVQRFYEEVFNQEKR